MLHKYTVFLPAALFRKLAAGPLSFGSSRIFYTSGT